MSGRLDELRGALQRLRRRRHWVRQARALGVIVAFTAGLLVAVFLCDLVFEMDRAQRLLALVLASFAWGAGYRRFAREDLRRRDRLVELALHCDRASGADGDFVAALEFEEASPEPRSTDTLREGFESRGSLELRDAVVRRAAERARGLGARLPVDTVRAGRHLLLGGLAGLSLLLIAWVWPTNTVVFLARLAFVDVEYPTSTLVAELRVNDTPLVLTSGRVEDSPSRPRVRCRSDLVLDLVVVGGQPLEPYVDVRGVVSARRARVEFVPRGPREWRAVVPRIDESVECSVRAGDARSVRFRVETLVPAIVELAAEVTPPDHARSASLPHVPPGARRFSVLEGSTVGLRVAATSKPLRRVWLDTASGEFEFASTGGTRVWALDPRSTPLVSVHAPVRASVRVEDVDGLAPDEPIEILIEPYPDRAPRVTASTVHRRVLPRARPSVSISASDDLALARISLVLRVERLGEVVSTIERVLEEIPTSPVPRLSHEASYTVDLSPYSLSIGDSVSLQVEAQDWRGTDAPARAASDPILLEITDRRGLFSELLEVDAVSSRRLESIIERELGVGGER